MHQFLFMLMIIIGAHAKDDISLAMEPMKIKNFTGNKINLEPNGDLSICGNVKTCHKDICKLYHDNNDTFGIIVVPNDMNLTVNGINDKKIIMIISPARQVEDSVYEPMLDSITICTGIIDCFTSIIYDLKTYMTEIVFVKPLYGCSIASHNFLH
ncbi:MAG: hypothetical protein Satyrvirus30_1 [Satyrvirus sp.]|uniref:Uncharacterized protein n=1 Tax=Satyrvirus sp. TaxID=2487771 RepID=A0A3G5AEM6_9VIRU|nr:MAG: hypothetical protein Satyrvirus30_1 [Satyrvirus sp.]